MLGGASVASMAQDTRDIGAFTEWVDHGYRPRRFAADVFTDFETAVGDVLS